MKKILVISGATASGKTDFAFNLALKLQTKLAKNSVIINADSMQVYRDLPILTAQPEQEMRVKVQHRLYGYLPAIKHCSVGLWLNHVKKEINSAFLNYQIPTLVGGTGMYIKSLIEGIAVMPDISAGTKTAVKNILENLTLEEFFEQLIKKDPKIIGKIKKSDSQRLIRAMEVFLETGISIIDWQKKTREKYFDQNFFKCFFLDVEREKIYKNINLRFEKMIESNVILEVEKLLEKRLEQSLPIMRAHGVPELSSYLRGEIKIEEAIEKTKQVTRNYAKRQLTWFNNQMSYFERIKSDEMEKIISNL